MTIHLINVIDEIMEKTTKTLSDLRWIEQCFAYDKQDKLIDTLRKIHYLYYEFFYKAGFLKKEINYLCQEVCRTVDMNEITGTPSVDKTLATLKKSNHKGSEGKYIVVPVHTRIRTRDAYYLLTGLAAIEKGYSNVVLISKETVFNKKDLADTPDRLTYLDEIFPNYSPEKYRSVQEFALAHNRNYVEMLQDSKLYFGDTFYSFYVKKKIAAAIHDLLFSDMNLKEISIKNSFNNYSVMYKCFKRYGINVTNIPRFGL